LADAGWHYREINLVSGATAPLELDSVPKLAGGPLLEAEADSARVTGPLRGTWDARGGTSALDEPAISIAW
jgi:hypothetical protein